MTRKDLNFKIILMVGLLTIIVLVPIIIFADGIVGNSYDGYKADPNSVGDVSLYENNFHYTGCRVQNNASITYFVPTRYDEEWTKLSDNHPVDVKINCCGDGVCITESWANENVTSCPSDCDNSVCGDGTCSGSENCGNCESDCKCSGGYFCVDGTCQDTCGDGICDHNVGEDCTNCDDCACRYPDVCSQDGYCETQD